MQRRIVLLRRQDAGENRKRRSFADAKKSPNYAAPDLIRGPGPTRKAFACGPGPRISAPLHPGWHRGV